MLFTACGGAEGFNDVMTALREGPEEKFDVGDEQEASDDVKAVAKAFGASLVGITSYDERW